MSAREVILSIERGTQRDSVVTQKRYPQERAMKASGGRCDSDATCSVTAGWSPPKSKRSKLRFRD